MKVWSKTLTVEHVQEAVARVNREFPGCGVFLSSDISVHEGPRTRRLDGVHLRSRTGRHYPNSGTYGALREGELAASWTEWGWFLARVFEFDPAARCGEYHGVDDFHAQTGERFRDPRTPRERQLKRELPRMA